MRSDLTQEIYEDSFTLTTGDLSMDLVRLIDTPQFWQWFFCGGYVGPSVETALQFYACYSRPTVDRFTSFAGEYINYLRWSQGQCIQSPNQSPWN